MSERVQTRELRGVFAPAPDFHHWVGDVASRLKRVFAPAGDTVTDFVNNHPASVDNNRANLVMQDVVTMQPAEEQAETVLSQVS